MYEIDLAVEKIKSHPETEQYESFIKEYTPYVLATVSRKLGRYIQVENDEAFAIGLQALAEAIEKYDSAKGNFLSFARLVIERRTINWQVNQKNRSVVSIDGLSFTDSSPSLEDQVMLREEIQRFENELKIFGISFDDLINDGPKHADTRQNAKKIAGVVCLYPDLVSHLYQKKRLPYTEITRRFNISRKVLNSNRDYIISVIIVYVKEYNLLESWI